MKKHAFIPLYLAILLIGYGVAPVVNAAGEAPPAPKENLTEKRFGLTIRDPYRWMENADDFRLQKWRQAEAVYTDQQTSGPLRDALLNEFKTLYGTPGSEASSVVELDEYQLQGQRPQRFSPVAASDTSPGGHYKWVITPKNGNTDIQTVQIQDVATEKFLKDVLTVKFFDNDQFFWDADEKSLVYGTSRDGRMGGKTYQVRRHQLGTLQQTDEILYAADQPGDNFDLYRIEGNLWLIRSGPAGNFLLRHEPASGRWETVLETRPSAFQLIKIDAGKFWWVSYVEQPMGEVVNFDIASRQLKTVVPARDLPIDLYKAALLDNGLYVAYVRQAANELVYFDRATYQGRTIPLPSNGQVLFVGTNDDDPAKTDLYFQTYISGTDTYTYNPADGQLQLTEPGPRPDIPLEAIRVDYAPLKGWTAPIWIVKRKDTELSADTPVYLYGYGGFRINVLPTYRPNYYLPWLRRGGAVAFATLPGGLEYGEAWHQLGVRLQKRNVFDAFAAAAKNLLDRGWTRREKLVIRGGSNGGLLVAATARYYPQLFQAAAPMVGVHDMTRFSLYTAGSDWMGDYGDREVKPDYRNLVKISPYHALGQVTRYPSTIVMTSEQDDRVVPAHSFKFAARLQDRFPKGRHLLWVAKGTGHRLFASTPEENARTSSIMWGFLMEEVGLSQ